MAAASDLTLEPIPTPSPAYFLIHHTKILCSWLLVSLHRQLNPWTIGSEEPIQDVHMLSPDFMALQISPIGQFSSQAAGV